VLLVPHEPLNPDPLEAALGLLVHHHDALRLRYRPENGGWLQIHADPEADQALLWRAAAENAAGIEAIADRAQTSLDLERGPLLRAVHIRLADGGERLLLVIHHLVVDGVSWRILLEDLHSAYSQCVAGRTPRLPAKTSAFRDWSLRLADHARGEELRAELGYWEARTQAESWPCDHPEGSNLTRDAASLELRLTRDDTRRLLRGTGPACRARIQDLLLAVLARVLCRWTGRDEVPIELEGHGREDLFPELDLTRTVGWFTSVHPVRLHPAAGLGATIRAVREQLGQVPNHGIGYGLLKYLAPTEIRERLAAGPRPAVLFNYLGQLDAGFAGEPPPFAPAPEGSGDSCDPASPLVHEFAINGEILAGELRLEWRYSRARYRESTVRRLAEDYREELRALFTEDLGEARGVTPRDFPLARLDQDQLDALNLPWAGIDDLYPLSPMQQGMLFHALGEPAARLYVTQLAVDIDGLDSERFIAAWRAAIRRHDILRTAFPWREGLHTPLQAVHRDVELPVALEDWRGRDDIPEGLAALEAREYDRGFDLARAPLLRLVLARVAEDRHRLIWTCHHLLLDGWSQSLLWGEVLRHYRGEPAGTEPAGRYRDYIAWLARQDPKAGEAFWREQLRDLEEPCLLAPNPSRSADGGGHGTWLWRADRQWMLALKAFAGEQRITLNTLVQGAWAVLLYRHTGRRGVAFGATVAGRPTELPGADGLLGLFINTLPVIHPIEPSRPAGDWLRALQSRNLRLREYEHTPLYDIQRWAGRGGQALFDSLLVFENYPVDQALRAPGLGPRFGAVRQRDLTNYPLTLDIAAGDTLEIRYDYGRESFDEAAVRRIGHHMESLLGQMLDHPSRPVGHLALSDGGMPDVTPGRPSGYQALPVHALIRRRAEARPEAPALICGGETLSYAELEQWTNRLAHGLLRRGVGPETPVGVAVGRSLDMVAGALAVFKAGGVYVPLDPEQPAERLRRVLEEAGVGVLLKESRFGGPESMPTLRVCLDLDALDLWGEPATPPPVAVHPEQLAYLIHTSGSTGRPKGVAVAHGALGMQVQAMAALYGLEPRDRCLHFAAPVFDAALEQWAVPLIRGAALVIAPEWWSAERMLHEIGVHGISRVDLPPAYLAELAARADAARPPALRGITVGGEALTRRTYELAMARLCPERLVNAYGPTETVITPLAWKATPETACETTFAPIGLPLGERTAHVLDADLNPLPAGIAGELYIGGRGLARGYRSQPALTAERFLPDPFGAPGGRLYHTGDRARRLEDGSFEYLGRLDRQIKIRGYRIEPEEIEAHLLAHPAVAEAAVLALGGDAAKRLVAYVAMSGERLVAGQDHASPATHHSSLSTFLKERLPGYMVPTRIVALERLPRLPSGKPDRLRLPPPECADPPRVAPRTEAERRMAELWREILELDRIGVTDDFFELGGHSLLALRLVGLAERRMNLKLSLAQVLRSPTIEGLLRPPPDATSLVALNAADGGEPPLFCVHPAGGAVFGYQALARSLTRPVYGILCPGLADAAWNPDSLAAIAGDYARLLMAAQPDGPCHLLGWSLGGALAMAMAHDLERAGREVAFLGLVDSYVPGFDEDGWTPERAAREDLDGFLREFLPGGRAERLGEQVQRRLGDTPIDGAVLRRLLDELADPALPDAAQLARSFDLLQLLTRLARTHRVRPLRVAPHCWWSTNAGEAAAPALARLEQAWGRTARYSTGIPADHEGLVRAPEFLADIQELLAADRRSPSTPSLPDCP
jgi:amino acid adenylation domain-containing protein/non-ribosomal peptide synthase protein (TIGR01720 family)